MFRYTAGSAVRMIPAEILWLMVIEGKCQVLRVELCDGFLLRLFRVGLVVLHKFPDGLNLLKLFAVWVHLLELFKQFLLLLTEFLAS